MIQIIQMQKVQFKHVPRSCLVFVKSSEVLANVGKACQPPRPRASMFCELWTIFTEGGGGWVLKFKLQLLS